MKVMFDICHVKKHQTWKTHNYKNSLNKTQQVQ